MCTASWLIRPTGYELVFSRDESRGRRAALAPAAGERVGVRHLAPIDAEAGGTWLGVNELGLTVALLNAPDQREDNEPRTSRGLLVRELLDAVSGDEVRRRIASSDLTGFAGFRLLTLEPGGAPAVQSWDGRALRAETPRMPLASSSLGAARAHAERARVLADLARTRGRPEVETLLALHASHAPERGPWSACVHREDVVTVSACHVAVDAEQVRLRYLDGSPCEGTWGAPALLARRAPSLGLAAP